MNNLDVVLVALYRYWNYPIRLFHPILENVEGVKPHSIFLKQSRPNVFDLPTLREEKLFLNIIGDLHPKLVCFSVLTYLAPVARRLTKLIKERHPDILVIWGGIHPTIAPEDCINDVDILCRGEGEGALAELAVSLRDKKYYGSIRNLWVRDGNKITNNPMRPLIQDLDSLPFPSCGNKEYYFIGSNRVRKDDPAFFEGSLYISTSRGCPYFCSFCASGLQHTLSKGLGSFVRRRSVDNVINEIENFLTFDNSVNYVEFLDDNFATEDYWLEEFSEKYKKIKLPFSAFYYPGFVNSALLDKLASAGKVMINYGIQTGSDDIRNNIFDRPGKNSDIVSLIKEIEAHRLEIRSDVIIDNPYDTEQTLKETIQLMLHFPRSTNFLIHSLLFYPNYPLTKKALGDKYIRIEETGGDFLMKRIMKNIRYIPRMLPYTKKQKLQNIIWLIAFRHTEINLMKYAVFHDSLGARLCLVYLNLEAVVLGKINSFLWQQCWILYLVNAVKYALTGNYKTLFRKIKLHYNV